MRKSVRKSRRERGRDKAVKGKGMTKIRMRKAKKVTS